jgi:signal transduction histidine kinase
LIDSARHSGLQVTFRRVGEVPTLAPLLDLTVYRVIQEALTNAGKHGAGRVDLEVSYGLDVVTIVVSNPLGESESQGSGLGLIGMRERVAAVGGTFEAGPRGGTFRVRAVLPLARTGQELR